MDTIYERKKLKSYKDFYLSKKKQQGNFKNNLFLTSFSKLNTSTLRSQISINLKSKNNKKNLNKSNNKSLLKSTIYSKDTKPIYKKIINNLEKEFKTSLNNIDKNFKNIKYWGKKNYDNKFLKNNLLFKKKNNLYNKTKSRYNTTNDSKNDLKNTKTTIYNKINISNLFNNSKIWKLSHENSDIQFMHSTNSFNFNLDIKIITVDFNLLFKFIQSKFLKKILYKENFKKNLLLQIKNYRKLNFKNSKTEINYKFDIVYNDSLICEEINLFKLMDIIKNELENSNIEVNMLQLKKFLINK